MLIKLGRFGELYIGRQDIEDDVISILSHGTDMSRLTDRMPHCDSRILHAPGKCHHCDLFPEYQRYRKMAEINFTNETEIRKAPCPSLWERTAEQRDRWPGNRAEKTKYNNGGLVVT